MELLESGQKAIQLSRIRPKANRTFEIRPKGEGTFWEPDQKSMGLLRVRPKVDWDVLESAKKATEHFGNHVKMKIDFWEPCQIWIEIFSL